MEVLDGLQLHTSKGWASFKALSSSPSHESGKGKLYFKEDNKWYIKDDTGSEHNLTDTANKNLSNLETTSINQDLIPNASRDLGSETYRWDLFTEKIHQNIALGSTEKAYLSTITLAQPLTQTTERGFDVTVTTQNSPSGTNDHLNQGFVLTLNGNYVGTRSTNGISITNSVAGTSNDFLNTIGNQAIRGNANGTTTGLNVGVQGLALNGNLNSGVYGWAGFAKNNAVNIGSTGYGYNTGAGGYYVGLWGLVGTGLPTITSNSALRGDSNNTNASILEGYSSGTRTFHFDYYGKFTTSQAIHKIDTVNSKGYFLNNNSNAVTFEFFNEFGFHLSNSYANLGNLSGSYIWGVNSNGNVNFVNGRKVTFGSTLYNSSASAGLYNFLTGDTGNFGNYAFIKTSSGTAYQGGLLIGNADNSGSGFYSFKQTATFSASVNSVAYAFGLIENSATETWISRYFLTRGTQSRDLIIGYANNMGNVSFFSGNADVWGGGRGVIHVAEANTEPTSSPTSNSILLWAKSGYLKFRSSGGLVQNLVHSNVVFVSSMENLPSPVSNVITLANDTIYILVGNLTLTAGVRIVAGTGNAIWGYGTERCILSGTPGSGNAMINSTNTIELMNITLSVSGTGAKILNLDGSSNPFQIIDWFKVNFAGGIVGTIKSFFNCTFTLCAFISGLIDGLTFDGVQNAVVFSITSFSGMASGGTYLKTLSTTEFTSRFRLSGCSMSVPSGAFGIDFNSSTTILTEQYILETVKFSNSGTYLVGVNHTSPKSRFFGCEGTGFSNTNVFAGMYFNNNATTTTITTAGTYYKIAGTTIALSVNQRFTHTSNRLTYNLNSKKLFTGSGFIACSSGNNQVVSVKIAINGVVDDSSYSRFTTSGSGDIDQLNIIWAGELDEETDYVEVFVTNETNNTDVLVKELKFQIKEQKTA